MGDFFSICVDAEHWHSEREFGIVDPRNGTVAYSVTGDKLQIANAVVNVITGKDLLFVPIDHNPKYEAFAPTDERRCDGFLMSKSHCTLIFIEIKAQSVFSVKDDRHWINDAVDQLRATISRFGQENPNEYCRPNSIRIAFAANRGGGYRVKRVLASMKSKFLQDTRYMLVVDGRISIENVR